MTMTTEKLAELKPCPFCGNKPPVDLIDALYPSGIVWREIPEEDGLRSYHSWKDQMLGDHDCYRMGCDVSNGGCGAVIHADSRDEVIAAWNRRADDHGQPAGPVPKAQNDDMVLVQRGHLAAACYALHHPERNNKTILEKLRDAARSPAVADDKTLPFEKALAELIDKIDSGLDTGDILEGARLASVALDAIMTGGGLVSNAHDYFRDTDRYETSVDFRIGWNACLDAIGRARAAADQPAEEGGKS